jgi:hypothetical protein
MHRFARPVAFAWLSLGAIGAIPLSAAEIQTTHLADAPDLNLADGVCDSSDEANVDHDGDPATPLRGQCTLRAAVQTANANPGPDVIRLRSERYVLALAGPGEDAAVTGDLDITSDVTIDGGGYTNSLIDARRLRDRAFDVRPGGQLTFQEASMLSGKAPKPELEPDDSPDTAGDGGCLRAGGPTSVREAFFFRCQTTTDGGCLSATDDVTLSDAIFSAYQYS